LNPPIDELKFAAVREAYEELGSDIIVQDVTYFGNVKFTTCSGKLAVAHKFTAKITGSPKVNEPEGFSHFKWSSYEDLEKESISSDLRLVLPRLKELLNH